MQQYPAIVIGSGLTALGLVRCLGRLKIPVYHITTQGDFARFSRWHKSVITLDSLPTSNSINYVLKRFQNQCGVVFPSSDELAIATASLTSDLSTILKSSLAPKDCIISLIDKLILSKLLKKYNIPHPITTSIEKPDDINGLDFLNKYFLKPRDSQKFIREYGVKALHLENFRGNKNKIEQILKSGHQIILQEYVPGPATNHFFVDGFMDRFGNIRAFFARQRIRMYPRDFGNSSCMISIPLGEIESAVSHVRKFLPAIKYRGIFSIEFKYDDRDKQYKLIEINARPWWYIEFAAYCGVNVCKLAYEDALGLDVKPILSYKVGKRFVYPYYDFACSSRLVRERKLTLLNLAQFWWRAKTPMFCLDDPLPSLYNSYKSVSGYLRRRFR